MYTIGCWLCACTIVYICTHCIFAYLFILHKKSQKKWNSFIEYYYNAI